MSKITQSSRGQDCTIRLPGLCNHNPETVVFAHLNGGGMGIKKSDLQGAYACFSCHDEVDRRTRMFSSDYAELCHRQGVERTQEILVIMGLLEIK
jgi:uncharacterized CHY-type Zn-finger protein